MIREKTGISNKKYTELVNNGFIKLKEGKDPLKYKITKSCIVYVDGTVFK